MTLEGLLNCTSYKIALLVQKQPRAQLSFWVVSGVDFEALASTQFYSHETMGNASLIFSSVGQKSH